MKFSRSLNQCGALLGRFKVGATLVEGQPCIWLSTAAGTITDPAAATDLTDAFGVTAEAGTYSTTQGSEGTAQVYYDPLAIFASRVVPSATAGTAYADADGYFLTNTVASAGGTLVSDGEVGGSNDDVNDGMIFCLSGANAGESRVITDMAANTSVTVVVPFSNAIAVGDTFVISQYAPGVDIVQMTTDFTQLDGTIAGGTGGEARVVSVRVDTDGLGTRSAPYVEAEIILDDHVFNAK